MHPDTTKNIAALRAGERHAAAAAARLARQARAGRAAAASARAGSGSGSADGASARRPRLLRRWAPSRPQSA